MSCQILGAECRTAPKVIRGRMRSDPLAHYGRIPIVVWVTGQLADTPTRGLPTRGHKSRTGQLATAHRRLCVLSFLSFGGICQTASCPVTVVCTRLALHVSRRLGFKLAEMTCRCHSMTHSHQH